MTKLHELTGGKGVTFATGTPISNSMCELYTNMRFLQYDTLQKLGLSQFDSWAATFGETQTAIELAPEGTGYHAKTRFSKFFNLPELIALFKEAADIQTADMLDLDIPEVDYENVVLKPSEAQKEMVQSLADRAERVRNRMVDSSVDNMLKITNDGRKLALDQRLINDMLSDSEDKQYQYKVGRKKVYMAPSAAEKEGYKRADKHPKATRFVRQNPIAARWNSEEQLIAWREQWAEAVNRALERAKIQERIDHRSNKDRGIDEQPTIHEGVATRLMEKKGIRTERAELNRQIKADNKAIRELKETVSRLLKAAKEKLSLPAIAEAMDKLRTRIIETMFYHMRNKNKIQEIESDIARWEPDINRYFEIGDEIKIKKEKCQKISKKHKETSLFSPFERHDLKREETTLTEEIEELKSERTGILSRNFMNDRADMKKARTTISSWKSSKESIEKHNKMLAAGIQKDAQEHKALRDNVSSEERPTLERMCAELYQGDKYNRRDRVQAKLSGEFDHDLYWQAEERVDARLGVDRNIEAQVKRDLDLKHELERVRNQPTRKRSKSKGMEI